MNKNKKDYLVFSLLFQLIICVVTFGLLFSLKFSGNNLYYDLKKQYFDKLDINYLTEIDNSAKSVFNNAAQKEIDKTVPETTESIKPTEKATTSETEHKNDDVTETEQLTAQIKAEGGFDYSVSSEDEIPANVSVNSYTLNQKMFLPATGETTSEFGIRTHPIYGTLRFHAGIDIANEIGTPIYSAFDGEIIVADYDEWNGNYIKIAHDNGIMTVYCHCNELYVKKGERVKAGQKIAEMGSTGSSTGPHLHFELRINNISYNPQPALNDAVNAV